MNKTAYKRYELKVSEPNKVFSKSFELDKTFTTLKGIVISGDRRDLVYLRGSQRIEMNKEELFPEDYLSEMLMSGIEVPINQRFHELGSIETGNKILKVEYKDSDAAGAPFTPYTVFITVKCEQE